jgi:hypothetical protein
VNFTPEIAQCPLGDLAFKVHTLHCPYSSTIVKTLWDAGQAILTSVAICSLIFPYVTNILLCLRIGDPEALLLIHAQVVQKEEEHIKIGAGFYPNDALGSNIDANWQAA